MLGDPPETESENFSEGLKKANTWKGLSTFLMTTCESSLLCMIKAVVRPAGRGIGGEKERAW